MPLTKIQEGSIEAGAINTTDLGPNVTATYATFAALAANLTPRITTVNVANSAYTILDDTSVNTSGGYLVITGANFQSGAIVTIDTTNATSTTFVNSTILRAQVPSKNAGSYNLYVTNPDGGTAIKVLGVSFSNTPVWGTAATLSNQVANTSFNVSISATSDSSVTYSNTTALPAGTQLLSNGYFYGTVTIGAETTYTFTVNAVDAENQDTPREFSLTVTVTPVNSLWTWGQNNFGQLGLGNTIFRSSPVQVGSDITWSSIVTSIWASSAIKTDGTLWAWGYNDGNLGLNNKITQSSPVQVGTNTNWSKIAKLDAVYGRAIAAIKTDGTLWTWGYNDNGQLGLGNTVYRSSPVQVGAGTDWSNIQGGINGCVLASKTNGSLWAWGNNSNGGLGINDRVNRSSPTQIGTNTNWNLFSIGKYSSSAIKTDGTLWSWGYAAEGQLGNESTVHRSSPIQIGTSTNWSKIFAATDMRLAIKTDGTLWVWGDNQVGGLGLNAVTTKSSPTQVGTDTNWNLISGGLDVNAPNGSSIGIKTNNTLWTWGLNNNGQLGHNDRVNRSSPTQVGTDTNWNLISAGKDVTMLTKK